MSTDSAVPASPARRGRLALEIFFAVVLGWAAATGATALFKDKDVITVSPGAVQIQAHQTQEGYTGFWRGTPGALEEGVLVLFDPMCPHCGALWEALAREKIPQFWVPVSILDKTRSNELGAVLIETQARAGDAAAQMSRFKTTSAMDPELDLPPTADTLEITQQNTRLFFDTGKRSVPVIVMKSADNRYKIMNGSMEIDSFRQAFQEFHNEQR